MKTRLLKALKNCTYIYCPSLTNSAINKCIVKSSIDYWSACGFKFK